MRMTKVVDRIVIDVSSCHTALHLVTHSHYQVFDPVVDFREKSLCFRAVLARFVHVFVECFITRISGPAILVALFRDEKRLLQLIIMRLRGDNDEPLKVIAELP